MNKRSSDLEPISGSVRFSTNKVRTQHWRRVGNFTQAKVPQNLFLTPWVKGKWQLSVPSNNSTSGQATGRPTLLVWTSSLQRTQLMQTRKWRHFWLSSGAQPTNCSKISSLRTSHRTRITKGGGEKKIAPTATKKERGEEAPMPRTVRGLPQTLEPGPSSRFQPPRPFERLPLCLFRKVLVVPRLSKVIPSGSSDVEENCLTPQLSSAVVRLVLEVKLYAFSLRPMATFTLFDQVSRACPWFSPLREASGRQSEICACSSVPSPAPSTEISCLQVSAKRPEPLKVSSPLTSSWAYSSALAQVSSKKAKWEVPGVEARGQWIWLIPGSRWTNHEQAWTKSTSPKSTQTQSWRKRFSCPNGANRRASGAKTAASTANRLASACSVAGAKSATPTACVTSAEMALGLRQTSHSAGHWRFLPPFFFCGCWSNFFFTAPLLRSAL